MKSTSLVYRERLRRHFGAASAIAALFAVCGGANADDYVNVCVVAATATDCLKYCGPPKNDYKICVDREPVQTADLGNGTVAIVWNLNSASGWRLQPIKGIDIKPNSHPKKPWKHHQGSSTQHDATNDKDGLQYTYKINVRNGLMASDWDPTIMN
jgi:hypothetical protein